MTPQLDLPAIVAGREIRGTEEVREFEGLAGPIRVRTPEIRTEHLAGIFEAQESMNALPLEEVLDFLGAVGDLWRDPEYPLLEEAMAAMERITQFGRAELTEDFGYIPAMADRNLFLGALADGEMPDAAMLEDWTPRGGSLVKAVPRGRFLHILSGNVPGVELLSLARGLVTRNLNVLKTASANPASPVFLLKSFAEVDPDHPVTRATSAFRWERGSDVEKHLFARVQSACVWGGGEAVHAAWRHARPGLEILDYGPKRSMAFVGAATLAESEALERAAAALARDTVVHDQQACHSPQVVFIEGDPEAFCGALSDCLAELARTYPRGGESIDRQSERSHLRMMCELRGERVYHPGSHDWTLIVTRDFARTADSPLGRTLFVVPVENMAKAVSYADEWTMVAAFSDRADLERHRDELARRGVDRLTDLGRMGLFPPGMPHEGRFDLSRLVRFVSADAPLATESPAEGAAAAPESGMPGAPGQSGTTPITQEVRS